MRFTRPFKTAITHEELDGLRAILAIMVAINHSLIWLKISGHIQFADRPTLFSLHHLSEWAMRLLLCMANGTAAVLCFFVISGFVLSLTFNRLLPTNENSSFFKQSLINYRYLFSQRFFRLFPTNIFLTIIVTLGLYKFSLPLTNQAATDWYFYYPRTAPDLSEVVKNCLFLSSSILSVTWSLFYEVWPLIITFPILAQANKLINRKMQLILLAVIFAIGQVNLPFYHGTNPLAYMFLFYAGLIVEQNLAYLSRLKISNPLFYLLCLGIPKLFIESQHTAFIIESILAILLVTSLLIYSSAKNNKSLFNCMYLRWLGLRSYGFYMVHFPILYFLASCMLKYVPTATLINYSCSILLFSAVVSIFIAIIICQFIIYPFELFWINLRKKGFSPLFLMKRKLKTTGAECDIDQTA